MKQSLKPTQDRWRQMIEEIAESDADGVGCADIESNLMAGYVDMLLAGEQPGPEYADLQRHVAGCPRCSQEVNAMLQVLRAEEAGQLVRPKRVPRPDLSFLSDAQPSPSIGDRLDDLFAGAQGWVRDQGSIWLDLGTLLGQSNQLVAARAMRGKENTQEDPVQRVSLGTDELGNCDLEIEIRKAARPDLYSISVQVNIPNRWPLLGNVEVKAIIEDQEYSKKTDREGRVIFEGVPASQVNDIFFRVTP